LSAAAQSVASKPKLAPEPLPFDFTDLRFLARTVLFFDCDAE